MSNPLNREQIFHAIAEKVVQELYKAGYTHTYEDNGFAFDRAIHTLGLDISNWTDEDWEEFGVIEQKIISDINEGKDKDKDDDIVIFDAEDEELPVYLHYEGQTNAQDAYIEIDCEAKTIDASCNGEIGNAVPTDVWHGKTLRFPIDNQLSGSNIKSLIEEILPLVKELFAEYESHYDGNNYVGRLTEKGEDITQKIHSICESAECSPNVWSSIEWASGDDILDRLKEHDYDATSTYNALINQAERDDVRLCYKPELERTIDNLIATVAVVKGFIKQEIESREIQKLSVDKIFDGLKSDLVVECKEQLAIKDKYFDLDRIDTADARDKVLDILIDDVVGIIENLGTKS